MKTEVKQAMHLKEMQQFLSESIRTREPVWLVTLTRDGRLHRYDGWLVFSEWWRQGTHDLVNPANGEKRKVRDVLIFSVNGHPVYM